MLGLLALAAIAATAGLGMLHRAASPEALEARLDDGLREKTGGLYRVRLEDTSYDLGQRSFTIGRFRVAPDSLELKRRREARNAPELTFTLEADAIHLHGVDLGALARGGVVARTVTLDALVARVFVSRHQATRGERRPARMPHQLLAKIPRSIRIDTLAVRRGSVHYSETPRDNYRPGTIRFEDIEAVVYGLANRPRRESEAPCRVDLSMLLAGEGRTEISLVYDLMSPRLDLMYQGTISRMRAAAFNEILVDLEGIRVKGGVLDSTWFEFEVDDGVARGEVQVLYHGLDSEMIDKVTHESGLSHDIATFIGNTFKIRSANPPNGETPAIVVPVRREREKPENFLRFLWLNVRAGLYTTLGIG